MDMGEPGKYFEANQDRLQRVTEAEWAVALNKCKKYIKNRLGKWSTFGAHSVKRLGEEAEDYYSSYAYTAIIFGDWEWKQRHSLGQQMILIAYSTMSTEVDKTRTGIEPKFVSDDPDLLFYECDPLPDDLEFTKEILIAKQIEVVEEAIRGDTELELFWDCVKEGMKRSEIAAFMEIPDRRHDKLRERLVKKVKNSPYFDMD